MNNNEYVGVDEKFVPEEEKNKTYVSEPLMKQSTKRKVFKGASIVYVVLACIVFVAVIAAFIIVIINFSNQTREYDEMKRANEQTHQEIREQIEREQEEFDEDYSETEQFIQNLRKETGN